MEVVARCDPIRSEAFIFGFFKLAAGRRDERAAAAGSGRF